MLNAIFVIGRARFLIARNTFWRGKIGRKIGIVVLFVALGFGAWGLYQLMSSAVQLFTSDQFTAMLRQAQRQQPGLNIPTDFRPYLEALPSIVLFGALVLLILTSFGNLLASLYLSGDMDMLLVAPVPMRSVFIVKFFSGLVIPYIVLFVLLGPALLGFGQGLGYGWVYYLSVIVVLALFPLLPVGLGALLVMAVVRVIPARRAREIVGLIGGLVGASWWILSQFSREIAPRMATVNTLDSLRRLNVPVLPSGMGRARADGGWPGRVADAAGVRRAVCGAVDWCVCGLHTADRAAILCWLEQHVSAGRQGSPAKQESGTTNHHARVVWFSVLSSRFCVAPAVRRDFCQRPAPVPARFTQRAAINFSVSVSRLLDLPVTPWRHGIWWWDTIPASVGATDCGGHLILHLLEPVECHGWHGHQPRGPGILAAQDRAGQRLADFDRQARAGLHAISDRRHAVCGGPLAAAR